MVYLVSAWLDESCTLFVYILSKTLCNMLNVCQNNSVHVPARSPTCEFFDYIEVISMGYFMQNLKEWVDSLQLPSCSF